MRNGIWSWWGGYWGVGMNRNLVGVWLLAYLVVLDLRERELQWFLAL
jgi:hypothetical protein